MGDPGAVAKVQCASCVAPKSESRVAQGSDAACARHTAGLLVVCRASPGKRGPCRLSAHPGWTCQATARLCAPGATCWLPGCPSAADHPLCPPHDSACQKQTEGLAAGPARQRRHTPAPPGAFNTGRYLISNPNPSLHLTGRPRRLGPAGPVLGRAGRHLDRLREDGPAVRAAAGGARARPLRVRATCPAQTSRKSRKVATAHV